jgi:alpha-amylase
MIGLHSHQPVGNFDKVIELAYQQAYVTLIDYLDRHPTVKVSLHYSGCLLEWLEANHPELLARIRTVVARGQAEVLSGGFFEPILSVLPPADARAQLEMLNDFIRKQFGYEPQGFWLAERVWEPNIPTLASQAGLRYTVLDQSHFLSSGIGKDDANGYYMTEDQGNTLAVFPIDYTLRYTIPWKPVQATIDYLWAKHEAQPGLGWTFADDGEKFGSWPETWENIIEKGWFEEFFAKIEGAGDWLETQTFSQFMASQPPSGRAYFPTASYPEMLRWSLPPHVHEPLEEFLASVNDPASRDFIQAGFWRNFMAKYPEANNLHKRMIRASRRIAQSKQPEKVRHDALTHLLRSQCNCPYWHGVFGGLYLNFLRHATYAEMLTGEAMAAPVDGVLVETYDFDADGQDEIIIENSKQVLLFSPHGGGALSEWDWRAFPTNLLDTMARRKESYHAKIASATVKGSAGSADLAGVTLAKTEGIADALNYDRYNRWCLIDIFPAPETTAEMFARVAYSDEGDFFRGAYAPVLKSTPKKALLTLTREGKLARGGEGWRLRITKCIEAIADRPGMKLSYRLENIEGNAYSGIFGMEWNLGLLAGWADDRYYLINGMRSPGDMRLATSGQHNGVAEIGIVDHWQHADIRLKPSIPADVWRYPVETASLSEGGYEKTYQASAVFPHWAVTLPSGGTWEVEMNVSVLEPVWHAPES